MIRFISPLVSKSFPELIHNNCVHRRLGLTEAHTHLCSPGSRFLLQWSRAVPATSGVTYGGTGGLRSFVNLSRTLTVLFLKPCDFEVTLTKHSFVFLLLSVARFHLPDCRELGLLRFNRCDPDSGKQPRPFVISYRISKDAI